ncbi:MAG: YggS family pyridoxal phosphate-dependent enzyme [Caulobacterales bacterium]|uniref:YggS family pyridoxal phosphate-dependent enzyme n=1 Tax=Glycocaulis sp. TaxID=1969725 RepID=UPI003F9FA97D
MTHTPEPHPIAARRAAILEELADAAKAGGRAGADVTLVAVSKVQPEPRIEAALAAGQRVFGENRVQEAQARWSARRAQYPDLELRLVGPLQTNKAEDAVALFDVIETLDREKLARALLKAMEKTGRAPRLYVQVNTGEEPQKAGVAPKDVPAFVDAMRALMPQGIEGLMCIPPVEEPASLHFALLAKLARETGLSKLSMGMSADYALAARLGATSVRVGSGLFGEREG